MATRAKPRRKNLLARYEAPAIGGEIDVALKVFVVKRKDEVSDRWHYGAGTPKRK
jgi:trimethylamine:corrinoid methyltransferase-like protein